ncbi:sugar diacid utilization regulator SdaR [Klebsiella grimontii]|uniref:Sugar diacid utilization regulator SdaR n=1 Tax=Klebsiella grimontii TaxID=2058152 RepID=A0A7H4P9X2_9ENTR|nr:sugar diacid utilization regulator SdaR [Klebsiella grimontii]
MAGWHLDTKMAQDIVARTMRIIDTNINVMDARGRIIGSGDRERIGELHEGALLVLSQGRVVDIDDAVARHLHGVRQGINLPLRLEGEIVGVIGLTGEPESLRKYGELVCMTAEMMLEQSRLMHLLAQDSRLREELVMNLIQAEENTPALTEWAQRLGIDLNQPRVVAMIEVDSGQLGVDSAMAELQQLQTALTTPDRNNLVAIGLADGNGGAETRAECLWPLGCGRSLQTGRAADQQDERETVSCVFAWRWETFLPGRAASPVHTAPPEPR